MDDKFGYNEMKNVIDSNAIEEQQRQEMLRAQQEQYEKERANADQVQYEYERAEAIKERDNTLNDLKSKYDVPNVGQTTTYNESAMLDSLQDKNYLAQRQQANEDFEREKAQLENDIANRNIDFFEAVRMEFALIQKQHTQIVEKEVEPSLVQALKDKAKKALPYIVAGAITVGTIAAGINVFTQPEPVQQDNFQPNSVEDVIEHRNEQIENGITTHPEHVIDDSNLNSQDDRQKVIRIESQVNTYDEGTTRGGRN